MEHSKYLVDVVDEHDRVVSRKLRGDIDKSKDIYRSAHILLITPLGEPVLTHIPEREDLPNLYPNQLGITVSTILRSGETPDQAASRAISRELFIDEPDLHHLENRFVQLKGRSGSFISAYYLIADAPSTYSKTDSAGFVTMSAHALSRELATHSEKFAQPLVEFWRLYKDKLPV